MPQMSPMSWIFLFCLFNIVLGMSFSKIVFLANVKSSSESSEVSYSYFSFII